MTCPAILILQKFIRQWKGTTETQRRWKSKRTSDFKPAEYKLWFLLHLPWKRCYTGPHWTPYWYHHSTCVSWLHSALHLLEQSEQKADVLQESHIHRSPPSVRSRSLSHKDGTTSAVFITPLPLMFSL